MTRSDHRESAPGRLIACHTCSSEIGHCRTTVATRDESTNWKGWSTASAVAISRNWIYTARHRFCTHARSRLNTRKQTIRPIDFIRGLYATRQHKNITLTDNNIHSNKQKQKNTSTTTQRSATTKRDKLSFKQLCYTIHGVTVISFCL